MAILKLLSWNVNGLRAVAKKGFAEAMAAIDADIICLQEIKAKPEQLPEEVLNLPGYSGYFFPAERPGYSGVAVYSKREPDKITYGMGDKYFDDEGRVLILDFPAFRLLNIYFPNGGGGDDRLAYKMEFNRALSSYVQKEEKPLIICGDVNTAHQEIDLARPKENETRSGFMPIERAWIDEFLELGFVDAYRRYIKEGGNYSWWDMKTRARERNVGWRIDYFFVSKTLESRLRDAYLLPGVLGSDHCPMVLDMEI